jgi:hypothetical protein
MTDDYIDQRRQANDVWFDNVQAGGFESLCPPSPPTPPPDDEHEAWVTNTGLPHRLEGEPAKVYVSGRRPPEYWVNGVPFASGTCTEYLEAERAWYVTKGGGGLLTKRAIP